MNGWCVIDKKGIGELIGVSDAKAWNVIMKLQQFGFVEINELAKQMRVTDKYLSVVNAGIAHAIHDTQEEQPKQELKPNEVKDSDKSEYTQDERDAFRNFQQWVATNAPRVAKMKEQMTISDFVKLKQRLSTVKLIEILKKMHNWEPLLSTNRNVYLTICNWINRDEKQ